MCIDKITSAPVFSLVVQKRDQKSQKLQTHNYGIATAGTEP